MKSIDLTTANLFKLGLTPEILKSDFENWLLKNDDFIVDFDSQKIHIGKKNLKHQINFSFALHKKGLYEQGMSDEKINEYIAQTKSKLKTKLEKELYSFPEELQLEFLIKTMVINSDKLSKINDDIVKSITDNILKDDLLSDDSEEKISTKVNNTETLSDEVLLPATTLNQIDQRLEMWIKNYEIENDYIEIPPSIEEKRKWVTDKYKNYEERYYKSQIAICNSILTVAANDIQIKEIKNEFKNKLIALRNETPLPDNDIHKLISEIDNAFYKLERFMKGIDLEYKAYFFNDAFTLLFNEMNKLENKSLKNESRINGYYKVINQIYYDYDKSDFSNNDAYDNKDFNRDCNEIIYLASDRCEDFNIDPDGNEMKISITDIANNIVPTIETTVKQNSTSLENPYPRIFTSALAYKKFTRLVDKFEKTPNDLANYSFVYHRMVKDKFIYSDYKQTEFVYFLLDFKINIDRIKPKTQLGNNDLRESIYNGLK